MKRSIKNKKAKKTMSNRTDNIHFYYKYCASGIYAVGAVFLFIADYILLDRLVVKIERA